MSEGIVARFTPGEWEILLKAPVMIFLLVAAADGKIESREVDGFLKVMRDAATCKSELLRHVLRDIIRKFPVILSEVLSASADAGRLLLDVRNIVDAKLPLDEALEFRKSLLLIGRQVVAVDIGKEEEAALESAAIILNVPA